MSEPQEKSLVLKTEEEVLAAIESGKTLEGITVKQISFRNQTITSPLTFRQCEIGGFSIKKCTFSAPLLFSDVTFLEEVDWNAETGANVFEAEVVFQNCVFEGEVQAKAVEFFRNASWEKCRFVKRVSFPNARFRGKVSFEGAQFVETCRFEDMAFDAAVFFTETRFGGKANFKKTRFSENTFFRKSVFVDGSTFENAAIHTARFEDMHANNKMVFKNVSFQGKSYFHRVVWDDEISFRGCDFHDNAYLSYMKCSGKADFAGLEAFHGFTMEESVFSDAVDFSQSIFHHDVYLRGTVFSKEVNFANTAFSMRFDCKDLKLGGNIKLEDSRPQCMAVEKGQIQGKIASEIAGNYAQAAQVYAMLRKNFELLGDHDAIDWAYYHFRRCERKAQKGQSFFRFCNWLFFDLGSGYGTKPFNIAILAVMVVLLFSSIFWAFGEQFIIDPNLRTAGATGISFPQSIYLSAMTFTTVGVNGITPQFDNWLKYFLVFESFLGLFLMTVFVGVYTRKMAK